MVNMNNCVMMSLREYKKIKRNQEKLLKIYLWNKIKVMLIQRKRNKIIDWMLKNYGKDC